MLFPDRLRARMCGACVIVHSHLFRVLKSIFSYAEFGAVQIL